MRKTNISFAMCVCPSVLPHGTRLPLDAFSWNFILAIFRKSVEKIQVSLKSDRKTDTLHVDRHMYIYDHIPLISSYNEKLSDKSYRLNHNSHITSVTFFLIIAVDDIMWKNIVEPDKPQMTVWRMIITSWITKATNTHVGFVIIIAFFTATMVAWTYLNVTLYVHCLSFLEQQCDSSCVTDVALTGYCHDCAAGRNWAVKFHPYRA